MSCHDIQSQFTDYLDGTLDESNQQQVDAHLAACAECRQYLSDIQATIALTRDLDEVDPPPFFTERIMAQVRQSARPRNWIFQIFFTPVRIPVGVLTAVCLVIVSLAANTWYLQSKDPATIQVVGVNTSPGITDPLINSGDPSQLLVKSDVPEMAAQKPPDLKITATVGNFDSDIKSIFQRLLEMDSRIDGIVSSSTKYRISATINNEKKKKLLSYIQQLMPNAQIIESLGSRQNIRVRILFLQKQ